MIFTEEKTQLLPFLKRSNLLELELEDANTAIFKVKSSEGRWISMITHEVSSPATEQLDNK